MLHLEGAYKEYYTEWTQSDMIQYSVLDILLECKWIIHRIEEINHI